MNGCPVHSDDDTDRSSRPSSSLPWDWIFLGLAVGMLTLVVSVALLAS